MPLRGMVLVLAVAIVSCIACRKEIYAWIRNIFSDHDKSNDEE